MVATVFTKPNPNVPGDGEVPQKVKRPLSQPSDVDNGVVVANRRPKSKDVTARYLLSSSSTSSSSTTTSNSATSSSSSSLSSTFNTRRSKTPLVPRTAPSTPRSSTRSQSAERRRPVKSQPPNTPENASAATKLPVKTTRNLSVSFQGEAYLVTPSKVKPAPAPVPALSTKKLRKGTPEKRRDTPGRDQTENCKPIDQQRWPGRSRDVNSLTKSVDCTAERKKLGESGNAIRALQKSMIHGSNNNLFSGKLNNQFVTRLNSDVDSTDQGVSDVESVSSGNTTGAGQDRGIAAPVCGGRSGVIVPARFLAGFKGSKITGMKTSAQTNTNSLKKLCSDNPPVGSPRGVSITRGFSSPLRGAIRPASPCKLVTMTPSSTCSSRGMLSPVRVRNGVASCDLSSTPSILSFAAEARNGKVDGNRIADAHLLGLQHNRYLQWRYANARADTAMLVQKVTVEFSVNTIWSRDELAIRQFSRFSLVEHSAFDYFTEESLYNACVSTSKLRHSVKSKRAELELQQQNLKLHSLLKKQMLYLDDWDLVDLDHTSSLSGIINALEATTVRLPIVGGARADIQNLKDAISSAVDVMHAMGSSICLLLSKVDQVNPLAYELASVTAKECALLDQCRDLLSELTALQVRECSLRTHVRQLRRSAQV